MKFPNARIVLSEITPRKSLDHKVRRTNDLILNRIKANDNVYFVSQENLCDPDYFKDDKHFSNHIAPLFEANLKRGLRLAFDIQSTHTRHHDKRPVKQTSRKTHRQNHKDIDNDKYEELEEIFRSFIPRLLDYRRLFYCECYVNCKLIICKPAKRANQHNIKKKKHPQNIR